MIFFRTSQRSLLAALLAALPLFAISACNRHTPTELELESREASLVEYVYVDGLTYERFLVGSTSIYLPQGFVHGAQSMTRAGISFDVYLPDFSPGPAAAIDQRAARLFLMLDAKRYLSAYANSIDNLKGALRALDAGHGVWRSDLGLVIYSKSATRVFMRPESERGAYRLNGFKCGPQLEEHHHNCSAGYLHDDELFIRFRFAEGLIPTWQDWWPQLDQFVATIQKVPMPNN